MKKKIQTYTRFISALAIALTMTQCFERCKTGPAEDTTRVDLIWETDSCSLSIPDELDLNPPTGWVCHVPSEKATYFLERTKPCWKFTQDGAGGLRAEKATELPGEYFTHRSSYFLVGPKGQEKLNLVEIFSDPATGDPTMAIRQLEGNTWVEKGTQSLLNFFPDCGWVEDYFVTACAIEKGGQYDACILFFMQHLNSGQDDLAGLLCKSGSSSLEKLTIEPTYAEYIRQQFPLSVQTSMAVSPGKLFLHKSKPGQPDSYDLLEVREDQLVPLQLGIQTALTVEAANNRSLANPQGPTWQSFSLLVDNAAIPVPVPIVSISDGDRKFFRMDEKHTFLPLNEVPGELKGKNTLVIPFPDCVYVLAGEADSDGKHTYLGYKAILGFQPPPKLVPTPKP